MAQSSNEALKNRKLIKLLAHLLNKHSVASTCSSLKISSYVRTVGTLEQRDFLRPRHTPHRSRSARAPAAAPRVTRAYIPRTHTLGRRYVARNVTPILKLD